MESYYREEEKYQHAATGAPAGESWKLDAKDLKQIYSMVDFFEAYIKKAAQRTSEMT